VLRTTIAMSCLISLTAGCAAPAAAARATTDRGDEAEVQTVCREELPTGSHIPRVVCFEVDAPPVYGPPLRDRLVPNRSTIRPRLPE
jgi:hypothetical protein